MNNLLNNENEGLNESFLKGREVSVISEKKQVVIARDMRETVNHVCGKTIDREHRNHLGASSIGDECVRYLWYKFRWMEKEVFVNYKTGEDVSGRMLRLFNRGHREEPVLLAHLRNAGAKIWEYDPSLPLKDGKPQQFRCTGVNGHFGGSLDGIILWPQFHEDYMLLEMKTYNCKRFMELQKCGVATSDPKYMAQMVVYGDAYSLHYAVFIAICKDDDEIHIEVVRLKDATVHLTGNDGTLEALTIVELRARAEYIINSPTAPDRIKYASPTFYKCKTCTMKPVCFGTEPADKNCRSCKFLQPIANKQWFCHKHQTTVPEETIKQEWPCHEEIK